MSSKDGYAGTRLARSGVRSAGRDHLARIQRERIVVAMAEVACERGAAAVTVAQVVARSRVSRRTFYEIFEDAHSCLLVTLEDALACACAYVGDAYEEDRPWRVRIRASLHALLRFLDEEPLRGRLLVVESLCAGPDVLARRARVLDGLVAAIDAGSGESPRGAAVTPLTAEGLVGSVLSVLHARLVAEEGVWFTTLTNPLTSMVVLPYLGAAAAQKELDRELPRSKRPRSPTPDGASRLSALPMRITYRTMRVLGAIASQPGASNAEIGFDSGVADQGQMSKLLWRLEGLGLIVNNGAGDARGLPNSWKLTPMGADVERAMRGTGLGS